MSAGWLSVFFFKQKTAYEMRISDWSSDVCSSDLTRYFLARVLQFQFYQAACKQAGWKGPLHRCSFYGNKEVGAKLNAMLEMGASKPWPDALEAFTGTREMSGKALADSSAPLKTWLANKNKRIAPGREASAPFNEPQTGRGHP